MGNLRATLAQRAPTPKYATGNVGTFKDRMFYLFAILATLQAQAGARQDAALLLSRFPAGAVPAIPTVMAAIDTLSESGQDDHLPLLRSLVSHEVGPVVGAASRAVAHITGESTIADAEPVEPAPVKTEELPAITVADVR
jgi:hypothetical protein